MKIPSSPFERVDWTTVEPVAHAGETGIATWRTQQLGDIRVRMVEYCAGYLADHWCPKGHVLLCLTGSLRTELDDGRVIELAAGDSYQVGDDSEAHRSSTATGATLFIVD